MMRGRPPAQQYAILGALDKGKSLSLIEIITLIKFNSRQAAINRLNKLAHSHFIEQVVPGIYTITQKGKYRLEVLTRQWVQTALDKKEISTPKVRYVVCPGCHTTLLLPLDLGRIRKIQCSSCHDNTVLYTTGITDGGVPLTSQGIPIKGECEISVTHLRVGVLRGIRIPEGEIRTVPIHEDKYA